MMLSDNPPIAEKPYDKECLSQKFWASTNPSYIRGRLHSRGQTNAKGYNLTQRNLIMSKADTVGSEEYRVTQYQGFRDSNELESRFEGVVGATQGAVNPLGSYRGLNPPTKTETSYSDVSSE